MLEALLEIAAFGPRTASGPDSGRALDRLVDPHLSLEASDLARFAPGSLRAESDGYSLHAATCIPAADREALEHLCRYVTRPPLAQGRLLLRDDGKVIWNLRKPWRDGTRGFVLDPLVFIERLVALIPHPREHQLTYHGVLASASPLRDDVVPLLRSRRARPGLGDPTHPPPSTTAARKRFSWAELLRRVFATDVLQCPRCKGRRHFVSVITDPAVIHRIFAHLNLPTEPLLLAPARAQPQPTLPW